jgi:hypothetical protein
MKLTIFFRFVREQRNDVVFVWHRRGLYYAVDINSVANKLEASHEYDIEPNKIIYYVHTKGVGSRTSNLNFVIRRTLL